MRKNKITAAILALFFGMFGVHKFYLRNPTHGVFYIFLTVMMSRMFPITQILGVIDAFRLLLMSEQDFDRLYNKDVQEWQSNQRGGRSQRDRRQTRRGPAAQQRNAPKRRQQRVPANNNRFKREHTSRKSRSYPTSNPYKQSGIRKFKEYDIKGAIEDFNKALTSSPEDVSLHFNLACSYSLNENADKSFYHLGKAVQNGFKDYEKISTHEALAYLRIQDGFEDFVERGYRLSADQQQVASPASDAGNLLDEDVLLKQLNKLSELRQKGLLTQEEFLEQKRRLMD